MDSIEGTTNQILRQLKASGRLSRLAVSETGFAFDPTTGQSFTLNQPAMDALRIIKSGEDCDGIVRTLSVEYDIPEDVVASGVEGFVRQLGRYMR
ncbi:MAG: PqqD family protein [Cyanobacteria bacterium HKST-UBA02]|nr:PqqD family protein [Cyanobacteria bacterium HKST-UBA02]